jgi:CBS domain-containing protein
MKCKDIMSKNLEWLTEQDTVRTAANRMADAGIGFLPICDRERRVVGVITDRDLVTRGMAKSVVPSTTSAALLMTSPPLTCLDTADLREAEELMGSAQKSRLVIVDADDRFVGVLSIVDLLEHAPGNGALRTARAVLWREALGPRAGAGPLDALLRDDAAARALPVPSDDIRIPDSVRKPRNHDVGMKEFPG